MDVQLEATEEPSKQMSETAEGPEAAIDPVRVQRELIEALARVDSLELKLACQARARTELVHLVSHELRTPITVISGFGRLLQNEAHGSLNKEQAHYIDESLKACRRLDQFVVDLLEAKTESGTPLSIEMAEGDVHALIRSNLESLAPLLEERGLSLEIQLGAHSALLSLDERRIDQVLTNLMSNAIRYGRPGGVIRVSTRTQASSDNPALQVMIDDDGPGIPVKDREHLFAPYVRGDGQTDGEGLGIGLAICRRVMSAHGGKIWVESSDLGGARFVFELPGRNPAIGEA